MLQKLHSSCSKSLNFLALLVAIFLFCANMFFRVEISYDVSEYVNIYNNVWKNCLVLVFVVIIIFFFHLCQKHIWKINQWRLFAVLSLVYMLCAAYLIHNSCNVLRADAKAVYKCSLLIKEYDYSCFQPSAYMYIYPHQIGLMLFDRLVSCFSENPSALFAVNTLLTIGINFTSWQISKLLWQDSRVHLLTILLNFMFIPQLFFVMFAYGTIPGMLFLLIGIYNTIKYIKTYRFRNLLGLFVSLTISVLVRKNNLIGLCAVLIFLFLQWLKKKNWRIILTIICLVVCVFGSSKAVLSFFENRADVRLDNGIPSVLWIAMGTNIDNSMRGAGWYDGSSKKIYMNANSDASAASAAGWEKLSNNIQKMKLRIPDTLRFFMNKIVSQWCEPLYQSVWSGPSVSGVQETYTRFLQSLYSGGTVENCFETYCKGFSLLLWIGIVVYHLFLRKENGCEIATAYFIGGFLFYIIWEAKSQYIYPYIVCLIPIASRGIFSVIACMGKKGSVFGHKHILDKDA